MDDSTPENGCLKFIKGSHIDQRLKSHNENNSKNLTLNQELANEEFDENEAVNVVLDRGQISLHDVYLVHGSEANNSPNARRAMTMRFMPTSSIFDHQLVKDKKYSDAIDSFNAFLYLFPKSNYASNAQYWLSESIYALGDFQNAMINFAKVVEIYPESSKIADAKLKIGYCYYSIKKWKEARFIFSSIVKNYPNTSLSQLADKKIKSMDVEGR